MPILRSAALAALAIGGLAFAPLTAGDDPVRPDLETVDFLIEDIAGDANFTNEQSLQDLTGDVVPETSTDPASLPEADILGARINGLYEEIVAEDGTVTLEHTGLEFRTTLAAEPTDETAPLLHRFNVTINGCSMLVQSYSGVNSRPDPSVRYSTGCTTGGDVAPEISEVNGPWITHHWDAATSELVIAIDQASATDIIRPLLDVGTYVKVDALFSQSDSVAVLLPVWDAAEGGNTTYFQIGSDAPTPSTPAPAPSPAPSPSPSPTAAP